MRNIVELIPRVAKMAEFLGYNLKLMREKKGLNQAQLAKAIGTDQGTVSKWENEKAHPPKQYHEVLTKKLDLPKDFFKKHWQRPVAAYDFEEILAEWKVMKERIAALEAQTKTIRAPAAPYSGNPTLQRLWSILQNADPAIQRACLYLCSGLEEDALEMEQTVQKETRLLRDHLKSGRG